MNLLTEQRWKNPFLGIAQWLIVVVIFLFLGKIVWDNWTQVREASFTFRLLPMILSTLIFGSCYLVQFWVWYLITLKLGIALSLRETLEGWFYSQLGKYLPGKVWILLGRFYCYESKGRSKRIISIALYLETVTLLIAAGLLSLLALVSFRGEGPLNAGNQLWGVVSFLAFALFFSHPRILERLLNGVLVRLKREPFSLSISYFNVLRFTFLSIIVWLVGGIGFYVFVDSIFPVPFTHFMFLTGALALSSTLGLLALFAPSGLGVREGVLVYLLTFIMPGSVAVIISVATRLWMTLIEIGLVGMIYFVGLVRNGVKRGAQHV